MTAWNGRRRVGNMLRDCTRTPVSWNRRVLAEIVRRHRNGFAAAPDFQSRGLGNQVEGEKGGNIKGEVQAALDECSRISGWFQDPQLLKNPCPLSDFRPGRIPQGEALRAFRSSVCTIGQPEEAFGVTTQVDRSQNSGWPANRPPTTC
jgi:hypothetical protein